MQKMASPMSVLRGGKVETFFDMISPYTPFQKTFNRDYIACFSQFSTVSHSFPGFLTFSMVSVFSSRFPRFSRSFFLFIISSDNHRLEECRRNLRHELHSIF